jgi:predicted KAP-like P-loop ATPase
MNEYMKLLEDELKRLVKNKVKVSVVDSNYVIDVRGNQITVPLINTTIVRKNSIKSK